MKAVILAAGTGSRLGKISETKPKPLLEILGKPVIEHNIELCKKYGINDIFINLHHLPALIMDHLGNGDRFGVSLTYSVEKEILGTAGGVKQFADKLTDERFFVIYGDNYNNYNLDSILKNHIDKSADISIAVFQAENLNQGGVAFLNDENFITRFIEKPEKFVSMGWVNAAIYLMEPSLLKYIPDGFSDFGKDIIPEYIAKDFKVLGVKMPTPVIAIDTPKLLKKSKNVTLKNKAIFFDRDGVLNDLVKRNGGYYSPLKFKDFKLNSDAKIAIRLAKELGYLCIVVSNQSEITRKRMEISSLDEMTRLLRTELEIDDVFYCLHDDHNDTGCRKPNPGLIFQASDKWNIDLQMSFMIGDTWRDIGAAKNAGVKSILLGNEISGIYKPDKKVETLVEAIEHIKLVGV